MHRKILLLLLATLFVAGCKPRSVEAPPSPDELALVEAANNFAFDMYRELVKAGSPDSNVVFSPFSNFVALAMVGEGARGETAAEVWKALHLENRADSVLCILPDMLKRLEKKWHSDKASELWVSDGLFSDDICPVRSDYRNWFTHACGGEFRSVIFHNPAELPKTINLINAWVTEKTKGKIPALLTSADIHDNTVAVLVNTLYFAGKWVYPFDKKETHEAVFHMINGDTVSVMMMRRDMKQNLLRMLEMPSFQFLELPYESNRFSMLILLPVEQNGLLAFDSSLNWSTWKDWTCAMNTFQRMTVRMPRLKLENRKYMIPILDRMGVRRLFDPDEADLSGMLECRPAWVDKVVHGTNVEVDEEGTVAAAATAYNMASSIPPSFIVNHPYLFAIVDNENGALLFMGRIVNPVQQ